MPSVRNRSSLRGLFTRAMVRFTRKRALASWQMTRLSSSSPVTATTAPRAHLRLHARLTCVTTRHGRPQLFSQLAHAARIFLQQQHLMSLLQQRLGQIIADLAAAAYHDVHSLLSLPVPWPPRLHV